MFDQLFQTIEFVLCLVILQNQRPPATVSVMSVNLVDHGSPEAELVQSQCQDPVSHAIAQLLLSGVGYRDARAAHALIHNRIVSAGIEMGSHARAVMSFTLNTTMGTAALQQKYCVWGEPGRLLVGDVGYDVFQPRGGEVPPRDSETVRRQHHGGQLPVRPERVQQIPARGPQRPETRPRRVGATKRPCSTFPPRQEPKRFICDPSPAGQLAADVAAKISWARDQANDHYLGALPECFVMIDESAVDRVSTIHDLIVSMIHQICWNLEFLRRVSRYSAFMDNISWTAAECLVATIFHFLYLSKCVLNLKVLSL